MVLFFVNTMCLLAGFVLACAVILVAGLVFGIAFNIGFLRGLYRWKGQ